MRRRHNINRLFYNKWTSYFCILTTKVGIVRNFFFISFIRWFFTAKTVRIEVHVMRYTHNAKYYLHSTYDTIRILCERNWAVYVREYGGCICSFFVVCVHVHSSNSKRIPFEIGFRMARGFRWDPHPNNYVILVETSTEQPSQWHRSRLRHLRFEIISMRLFILWQYSDNMRMLCLHTNHWIHVYSSFVCVFVSVAAYNEK